MIPGVSLYRSSKNTAQIIPHFNFSLSYCHPAAEVTHMDKGANGNIEFVLQKWMEITQGRSLNVINAVWISARGVEQKERFLLTWRDEHWGSMGVPLLLGEEALRRSWAMGLGHAERSKREEMCNQGVKVMISERVENVWIF